MPRKGTAARTRLRSVPVYDRQRYQHEARYAGCPSGLGGTTRGLVSGGSARFVRFIIPSSASRIVFDRGAGHVHAVNGRRTDLDGRLRMVGRARDMVALHCRAPGPVTGRVRGVARRADELEPSNDAGRNGSSLAISLPRGGSSYSIASSNSARYRATLPVLAMAPASNTRAMKASLGTPSHWLASP